MILLIWAFDDGFFMLEKTETKCIALFFFINRKLEWKLSSVLELWQLYLTTW